MTNTTGAVAWINESNLEPVKYQVHAFDTRGSRLLASGPDIDPSSLALAKRAFYWSQGGRPFSASLD